MANLFKDILFEHLSIVKVGRNLKLYYKDSPIQILTNVLYTPFGVKSFENTYSSFSNYHVDCSVSDNETEEGKKFTQDIHDFDDKIKTLIMDNLNLFNGDKTIEDFPDSYAPFLKPGKNGYPGLMKISLVRDSRGNFETVLFNSDKVRIPLSEMDISQILKKGTSFKGILECSRLWYYNGKYGASFVFKQIKLETREKVEEKPTETFENIMIDSDNE